MTQFKGTQGKWAWDELSMKIKGTGDFEGMTVIANVSPKMDYSRDMATQSANALLISKAPEMLEMLNYLNNKGGLGLETHERLDNLIKEATELCH